MADDPTKKKRIAEIIDRMVAKGASDSEIEEYLTTVEGVKPPDATQEKSALRKLGDLAAPLAQGATFGLADEVLGGIDAANSLLPASMGGQGAKLSDLPASYRRGRDKVRAGTKQIETEQPNASLIANLVGGVGSAIGTGGASLTGKLGATGLKAALAEGAAQGGLTGFGQSDGGSLLRQLMDTGKGALAGGIVAPVAGFAGKIAGQVIGKARNMATPMATKAGTAADEVLTKMINNDGGLEQMLGRAANDKAVGMEVPVIATSGGKGVNDLAWLGANTPSAGRQTLVGALEGAKTAERPMLVDQLRSAANTGDESAYEATKRIGRQQKISSHRLYGAAEAADDIADPVILQRIREHPELKEAAAGALRSLGKDATETEKNAVIAIVHGGSDDAPIPVRLLNLMKQATDDVIRSRQTAGVGEGAKSTFGRLDERRIRGALSDILDRADPQAPEFASARLVHKADADRLGALAEGGNVLSKRPELVADELSGIVPMKGEGQRLLPQNAPDYKKGGVSAYVDLINDKAKAPGSELTKHIAGDGTTGARLEAMLGNEGRAAFEPALDAGRRVEATYKRAFGGSSTAGNEAVKDITVSEFTPADALQLIEAPKRAIYGFLSKLSTAERESFHESLAGALAERLAMDPTGEAAVPLLAKIREITDAGTAEAIAKRAQEQTRRWQQFGRLSGFLSGSATHSDRRESGE